MSWVTVIWSMVASACLTVAAIHFLVWYRHRPAWASLLFSMTAASTAGYAFTELATMHLQTTADAVVVTRWGQLWFFTLFVSIVWFVRVYLRAGRLWLAWTITVMRAVYVLFTVAGFNVNYREVSLSRIQFLGEPITVVGGIANPWTLFGQLAVLLILVFAVDAGVTVWRRGERRKAWTIGGSVAFFIVAGLASASIVLWANVPAPTFISQCYLGMVLVMGYELSRDVVRSSQLVGQLQASEAGLRESEARMSLAVEAGGLGIWVWNLADDTLWASDAWRSLFGLSSAEPLTVASLLQRVHPDDREPIRQTLQDAVTHAHEGLYQAEYRLLLPDGAVRWIASRGRIESGAEGRPTLMRGTSRDVTAQRLADQETQQLRQEIAHAGRVSMMGQLASALAHEINQPLGAILRNAEAAELFLQHPSPDLDEIRAILADIRQDDERAGRVIDGMRGLLKRNTLEAQRLEVGALVGEAAALVRVDAATRQVKLDVAVPGGLPPVRGDRVHLQQVLLNLILNGLDALGDAGRPDRRVRIDARLDGGRTVEIAVRDTGPGIPPDVLARIFDPFFTTKATGMGMGLAISRTIVEAHGGRLWAENLDSGGASFRFTLPLAEAAEAQ